MGTGSRIRWHKVAKLALAVLGCLALFAGLPSLIRRPEPLPLEPDIGLAPLAASRVPAGSGPRPEHGPERQAPKGADRHAAKGTDRHRRRVHDRRRLGPRRPSRREKEPPSTASPVAGGSAAAPVPVTTSVPTTAASPSPAPPPPRPTAPPPARVPASPGTASEFGFER